MGKNNCITICLTNNPLIIRRADDPKEKGYYGFQAITHDMYKICNLNAFGNQIIQDNCILVSFIMPLMPYRFSVTVFRVFLVRLEYVVTANT